MSLKSLTPAAMDKILAWRWPGNVRELQNVIERSCLMSASDQLQESDILIEGGELAVGNLEVTPVQLSPGMTLQEAERRLILKTLELTKANRTQAARMLGISIRTLRNKLHEYRLDSTIENQGDIG